MLAFIYSISWYSFFNQWLVFFDDDDDSGSDQIVDPDDYEFSDYEGENDFFSSDYEPPNFDDEEEDRNWW